MVARRGVLPEPDCPGRTEGVGEKDVIPGVLCDV
jgi:hypothetical protein